MRHFLILYYSWANGNTRRIAELLRNAAGADIAEIDTVTPYSGSYDEVVAQAQREVQSGFLPEIKPLNVDLGDYDAIAVGTPTWWYTMAPAVRAFFAQNDLAGKTVIPFMTHAGWPGHVIRDMTKAAAGASVCCPMKVRFDGEGGDRQVTKQSDLEKWIAEVIDVVGAAQ